MVSLGYVWGLVWAKVFFNEPLTKQKFAGLGLILLGVFFVGLGSQDAQPVGKALSPAKTASVSLAARH
jgi:drug/metabolite transporter (DMT)-like permease